jgi:hypothetical protein
MNLFYVLRCPFKDENCDMNGFDCEFCPYYHDEDEEEEEEETDEDTRFCPYANDTIFCNGICSECGNSKV